MKFLVIWNKSWFLFSLTPLLGTRAMSLRTHEAWSVRTVDTGALPSLLDRPRRRGWWSEASSRCSPEAEASPGRGGRFRLRVLGRVRHLLAPSTSPRVLPSCPCPLMDPRTSRGHRDSFPRLPPGRWRLCYPVLSTPPSRVIATATGPPWPRTGWIKPCLAACRPQPLRRWHRVLGDPGGQTLGRTWLARS